MSTLVDYINTLPSSPVDWEWYEGYHDRPLSGWIRVKSRRYYYSILNDGLNWFSLWGVYHVPRAIRIPFLLRHRRWRQTVGWNHDHHPSDRRGTIACGVERAGFEAYQEGEKFHGLPHFDFRNPQSGILLRGITDLKEVRWLVHETYDALDDEDL